jgi:uncharacterized protein (TIGR00251 family)
MRQTDSGVILSVRVNAGSGSFSIEREKSASPPSGSSDSCTILIRTKSPAEGNRANQEIVKELSKLFGREVRIIRGLKSSKKEILVKGISEGDVEKAI